MALFTTGGGISSIIALMGNNPISTIIAMGASFISAILIMFNQFSSIWIRSSAQLARLSSLYVELVTYSEKIHNLFLLLRCDHISQAKALEDLAHLNAKYADSTIAASEIFGSINKKSTKYKKAAEKQKEYLNSIYFYEEE